jgi:hypothetical protein
MLKSRGAAWALIALIAVVAAGALYSSIGLGNRRYGEAPSHLSPPAAHETIADVSAEDVAYYTKVLAWFTAVLAIVSAAQGVLLFRADKTARLSADAALKAAKATENSVEVAKTALRDTERAFVYLKTIEVRFERAPPWMRVNGREVDGRVLSFSLTPVWANSGKTPAMKMLLNVETEVFPCPEAPDKIGFQDDGTPRHGVLGPTTEMMVAPKPVTGDVLERLKSGQGSLLIWGWVDYNDVFPDTARHRTEFCLEIKIKIQADGSPLMGMQVYRRFNGFDGECFNPPKPYTSP